MLHDNRYYQPVSVLWYPTTLWEPGTPVRIRSLPWTLETERFVPLLGLYRGENWEEGEPLAITVPNAPAAEAAFDSPFPLLQGGKLVRLGGYQRTGAAEWQPIENAVQSPAIALDVDFGGMIALVGADLPTQAQAGTELPFTLHWQARAPVDFDYSAFAHLLDSQGNKVAQLDWQPHDRMGLLPTGAWPQGWPVTDSQRLPLPAELPAGDYALQIGLYDWRDGSRLPVQGASVIVADAVQLGPVRVE
jgi:hypothetical protein